MLQRTTRNHHSVRCSARESRGLADARRGEERTEPPAVAEGLPRVEVAHVSPGLGVNPLALVTVHHVGLAAADEVIVVIARLE